MPHATGTPQVSPYTCTFCDCLCDDLEIRVEGGRVVEAAGACERGRPLLIGIETAPAPAPPCRLEGVEATAEAAVRAAAEILSTAKAPLIVGLGRATNQAARKAVALADLIGAAIEVGDAASARPRIAAMQRSGSIGATLGEVKARADVVVFWGCDPAATHPRLLERCALVGREGRRAIAIDSHETATTRRADGFLTVEPERELDLLLTLRALVREVPLDPRRVEAATRHGLATLQELVESLQGARYGVWFQGSIAGRGPTTLAEARRQAVTALVRELARKTRFVTLGLGEAGNSHGAEGVLAWQTGFAPGVDFGAGFPESWPGDSSAADRFARGSFDAVLVVGGPVPPIPEGKPWVYLGDPSDKAFARATVAIPAGTPGVDDSGTFTRADGVSLPLRALRPPRMPGATEWLEKLIVAIEGAAT